MARKSDAEIRRHCEDLKVAMAMPCDCPKGDLRDHEKCIRGGQFMKVAYLNLMWALGENESHQKTVEGLRRKVDDYAHGK